MASTTMAKHRRELPETPAEESPEMKRAKPSEPSDGGGSGRHRVELNLADCDLDFNVEGDGLQGKALHEKGFAYCWSGARATVGITGGKYCFGCKIISEQTVEMEDTPPDQQHLCRLGISRGDDPVGNLGESEHSFGFGGTGKFSTARKFSDYGTKFGIGDTIVCAVDLESKPLASIGFSKNGKWLGSARQFDAGPMGLGTVNSSLRKLPWESALFPHVLLKNVVVQMQFSLEDGLVPEEGYKPWSSVLEDDNAITGPSFPGPKECEVLMMVGLPASGKSTWAKKWMKEHPEKRYVLLGTNLALDQMKVPGLMRNQNYGERFDRLMERATGIFDTLLPRAAKTPRNYILDQTNVYKSARRRKLKPFVNFRKIAVVVFPTPDELKFRAVKRFKEMGKEVPAEAVNEMLVNYDLPVSMDTPGAVEFFDEVIFPELSRGEAQRYLEEMKHAVRTNKKLSGKNDVSPYSHESSMQSFTSPPSVTNKAFSAIGGSWQGSPLPFPYPSDVFQSPIQGNPSFYGKPESSPMRYQSRTSDPSLPFPSGSPYGSNSDSGRFSLPRHATDPAGGYGCVDPYRRPNSDPYGSYGVNDAYNHANCEWPSSAGRPKYEDLRTPPSADLSAHIGRPVVPHAYHQAASEAPYRWQSYSPGYTSSYDSPPSQLRGSRVPHAAVEPPFEQHGPLPTNYGSPYAGPPSTPPYGNRPRGGQCHSEGYPPSGAWYR